MTFKTLLDSTVSALGTYIMPALLTLILFAFVWGVVRHFIIGASDEGARANGRQLVLWGIVGIVALVALWGIVNLLLSTLGITAGRGP
jgi:hypothetical protein